MSTTGLDKIDLRRHRPSSRPYVRKVKGCHECSQRRINCDRAEPECFKCQEKGIRCSGLGVRYRFNNGVASRGNLVGKTGNLAYGGDSSTHGRSFVPKEDSDKEIVAADSHSQLKNDCNDSFAVTSVSSIIQGCMNGISVPSSPSKSTTPLQRYLLLHFSKHIAKEMVAIDDSHNGWRYLLLPIAHMDQTVMDAVSAAAAFHLLINSSAPNNVPSQIFYTRALKGLREKRDLLDCDQATQRYILLTIIVLLVAVMVNAGSDFPLLFRLLESGLNTINDSNGLGKGELPEFLLRQTNKLRVYAAPLLDEKAGIDIISAQVNQSFDCLRYTGSFHPEHWVAVSFITELNQQAYRIYLHTVSRQYSQSSCFELVEKFKCTLEAFPSHSPGEHVLIWASFVAAAVSFTPKHRDFFRAALRKHHKRSGFGNIIQGLSILETIWKRGPAEIWTEHFTKAPIFIV